MGVLTAEFNSISLMAFGILSIESLITSYGFSAITSALTVPELLLVSEVTEFWFD